MKNLEGLYRAFSNFGSYNYEVVFESFSTNFVTRFLTGKRTYLKYYIREISQGGENKVLTFKTDSDGWEFRNVARWGFCYSEKIFYWQNSDDAINVIMTAKTRQGADTSKDTVVFSTKDLSSLPLLFLLCCFANVPTAEPTLLTQNFLFHTLVSQELFIRVYLES